MRTVANADWTRIIAARPRFTKDEANGAFIPSLSGMYACKVVVPASFLDEMANIDLQCKLTIRMVWISEYM